MSEKDNVVHKNFNKHDAPLQALQMLSVDIAEVARSHGFTEIEGYDLKFERWLDGCGSYYTDHSANMALVEFDPDGIYFARIDGPYLDVPHVIVFSMEPKFVYGEQWCFAMSVLLVCDAVDPECPVFSSEDEASGPLVITIKPGSDEYELTLTNGLRADFLTSTLLNPLETLLGLIAEHAATIQKGKMN